MNAHPMLFYFIVNVKLLYFYLQYYGKRQISSLPLPEHCVHWDSCPSPVVLANVPVGHGRRSVPVPAGQ